MLTARDPAFAFTAVSAAVSRGFDQQYVPVALRQF